MRTYSKVFYKQLSLYVLVLVLLVGCGSGGGGDNAGSSSTILSGVASKGPLANGIVTAFSIVNGQKGQVLSTTKTDSSGNYTLDIGSYSGPVLIEATGGTYKDEATGNTKTLNSTFRAAIAEIPPNDSGASVSVPANVTAITEAAVKNAIADAGGLTPLNIQTANDEVEAQIGFDPVTTKPADASDPSSAIASLAEKVYAFFLGAVSQYLNDNPSKSLDDATSDIATAVKAGNLLTGNVLITAAGNNFSANPNNKTAVLDMATIKEQVAALLELDNEYYKNQRAVAAALFKDDTISNCPGNTYPRYPSKCNANYNYNLFGMPGCFPDDGSNYIDDLNNKVYQPYGTFTWKNVGFINSKQCIDSDPTNDPKVNDNSYASQKWQTHTGKRMDGTHNGIDMSHKNPPNHPFYAVTPGVLIRSGGGDLETIAVYTADPDRLKTDNPEEGITTLYLHASTVAPKKGSIYGTKIEKCTLTKVSECPPSTFVSVGDYLGEQGTAGTRTAHVHISVRSGKKFNAVGCAYNDKNCETGDGYMPPIETILKLTPSLAPKFSSISAGWAHTVALKSDGTLWAWGDNEWGQLGDGTNIDKNIPTQIGSDNNWTAISAAYSHTVALKSDNTLWTWGYNGQGQLGDGTNIDKNIPTRIGTANNWTAISAGSAHTVALKSDGTHGTLWAWGTNAYGELGNWTTISKNIPTQIGSDNNWTAISAGGSHTVALKSDNTLWTWGYNGQGELGDGTNINKYTPTRIGSATNWKAISAGFYHTVALKSDGTHGTLWAWGNNDYGQLGDATNINKNTPTQIGTSTNWAAISTGGARTVALKSDGSHGTLWAWGYLFGLLNDATSIDKNTPTQIGTATDWTAISAGWSHTIALKSNGTSWAWGYNYAGQLGDGTNINKNTPTQIGADQSSSIIKFKITQF